MARPVGLADVLGLEFGRRLEGPAGSRANLPPAMDFALVGDSSLYTKKANGKKGLITSDLEQRLGGRTSVAYYPGGGIREILKHVANAPPCNIMGISYFGNEHTDLPIQAELYKPMWQKLFQLLPRKCERCTFFVGGFSRKWRLGSVYDQNLQLIRRWVSSAGFQVRTCSERVESWPLAKDRLHFSVEAKEDIVEHWVELLNEAHPVRGPRLPQKRPRAESPGSVTEEEAPEASFRLRRDGSVAEVEEVLRAFQAREVGVDVSAYSCSL